MNTQKYFAVRPLYLTLLVFFLLVLFYRPVFAPDFAYLNDYTAFMPLSFGFPESAGVFYIGRPLQAILANIQFRFLGDMLSLQIMRIFIVLMIATAAILFFRHLRNTLNIHRYTAALLSLLMFTLPSMTINSIHIAQSVPGIVPVFFVLLAHHLMQLRDDSSHNYYQILAAVFFLIFFSLLTYPPVTFFFLTLTFIKFLFGTKDPSRAKLNDIFAELAIMFAASVFYFLFIKYVFKPWLNGAVIEETGAYGFALSADLLGKFAQVKELFVFDLSAWFPPLGSYSIAVLGLVFVWSVARAIVRTPYLAHFGLRTRIIAGVVLAILIPIILTAPIFVIHGDYPILYRVSFASMAATMPVVIVLMLDRALQTEKTSAAFLMALFISTPYMVCAGKASYERLQVEVSRLSMEYQHVFDTVLRESANEHNKVDGRRIFRVPPFQYPPDPSGYLYRDFGYTSVDSSPEAMVRAVIQSIDASKRYHSGNMNMDGFHVSYDPNGPRYEAELKDGLVFQRAGYPIFIEGYKGISSREDWGRWTDGEEATLTFAQPLPRRFTLKIKAGAAPSIVGHPVEVIIGSVKLEAKFISPESTEVALEVATDTNAKSIILRFPSLRTEEKTEADRRRLGLALIRLDIKEESSVNHVTDKHLKGNLPAPLKATTKFPLDLLSEVKRDDVEVTGLSAIERKGIGDWTWAPNGGFNFKSKERWRWAVGGKTRIAFNIASATSGIVAPLLMKLSFKNGVGIPNQGVVVLLNGKEIRRFSTQEIDALALIEAEMRLNVIKGENVLELVYEDWNHGKKDYAAHDPRELAVVLMGLSMREIK